MFNYNPFGNNEDDGRDKRRCFTQSQKNEILYQQNNKCAMCGRRLDPRTTEFDHEKAWADRGRTITQNGRALHAECHKVKHHNKKVEAANKKSKSKKKASPNPLGMGVPDLKIPEFKMPKGGFF